MKVELRSIIKSRCKAVSVLISEYFVIFACFAALLHKQMAIFLSSLCLMIRLPNCGPSQVKRPQRSLAQQAPRVWCCGSTGMVGCGPYYPDKSASFHGAI